MALVFPARGDNSGHSVVESIISATSAQYDPNDTSTMVSTLMRENMLLKTTLLGGAIVVIIILIILLFVIRRLHKRQLEACRQFVLKQRDTEKANADLQDKRRELTSMALSLARSEELIRQMKNDLQKMLPEANEETTNGLDAVLKSLKSNDNIKDLWKEFDFRYNELNDNFIAKLTARYINLSPTEIRLCAMLRLQLSTKDISEITRRSVRTIECTRSSIRKKMALNPSDNLTNHLLSI